MNSVFWIMDEAPAFQTKNGGDNAKNVYGTLRTSAQSRFAWMHWIGIIISFPRKQQGDFTLDRYERAHKPDCEADCDKHSKDVFGDRAATWEVHPRYELIETELEGEEHFYLKSLGYKLERTEGDIAFLRHPMYQPFSDDWVIIEDLNVRVPVEFQEDFESEGVDAMTKFMAQPPLTEGGFFENPHTITEAINRDLPPLITTIGQREEFLAKDGIKRTYVTHTIEQYPPVIQGATYFMHGDPGLKKDSFSLAMCHTMPESKVIDEGKGAMVEIRRTIVDFLITWEPRPNRPVDLLNVDEVMQDLVRHYDVRRVTFDRWNSAHSIQALVKMGVDAEDMAFSNAEQMSMYRFARLLFYNNMIELPYDEALQNELKFLKEKNGKIEHDLYGKDRADAVVAAAWNASGRSLQRSASHAFTQIFDTGTNQVRALRLYRRTLRNSAVIGLIQQRVKLCGANRSK
jgi:hypothetical protein